MKVIIAEDDPSIANILAANVRHENMTAVVLSNGMDVIDYFSQKTADVLLLDIMMPGLDGYEVLKRLREHNDIPTIMITAKVTEADRLKGFELGVDDYVCKPFSPMEVMARIKSLLKRVDSTQGNTCHTTNEVKSISLNPDFEVDESKLLISYKGIALDLTVSEFKLMQSLAEHPNHIFEREKLLALISDISTDCTDRAIDSHIKNLRKKLRHIDKDANVIESVYGMGYKMVFAT
jgi:two-component system response regulator BaeR